MQAAPELVKQYEPAIRLEARDKPGDDAAALIDGYCLRHC